MAILVLGIISLPLAVLTYIPAVNWLCLVGFSFALTAWVGGRKVRQTTPNDKTALPAMALGIAGAAANLAGILFAFVIGTLTSGGSTVF